MEILKQNEILLEQGRAGVYTVVKNVQEYDVKLGDYVNKDIKNVLPMKQFALEHFEQVDTNEEGKPIYNWTSGLTLFELETIVENLKKMVEMKEITSFEDIEQPNGDIKRITTITKVQCFKESLTSFGENNDFVNEIVIPSNIVSQTEEIIKNENGDIEAVNN